MKMTNCPLRKQQHLLRIEGIGIKFDGISIAQSIPQRSFAYQPSGCDALRSLRRYPGSDVLNSTNPESGCITLLSLSAPLKSQPRKPRSNTLDSATTERYLGVVKQLL